MRYMCLFVCVVGCATRYADAYNQAYPWEESANWVEVNPTVLHDWVGTPYEDDNDPTIKWLFYGDRANVTLNNRGVGWIPVRPDGSGTKSATAKWVKLKVEYSGRYIKYTFDDEEVYTSYGVEAHDENHVKVRYLMGLGDSQVTWVLRFHGNPTMLDSFDDSHMPDGAQPGGDGDTFDPDTPDSFTGGSANFDAGSGSAAWDISIQPFTGIGGAWGTTSSIGSGTTASIDTSWYLTSSLKGFIDAVMVGFATVQAGLMLLNETKRQ